MHERVLRIWARAVAVFCEQRIEVVLAFTDIAGCLPLQSRLEGAPVTAEAGVDAIFERSARIQLTRVHHPVGVVLPFRQEACLAKSFDLGVHGRQAGSRRIVFVQERIVVVVVEIGVSL